MDIKPILNIVPGEIKTYVDDIDIRYTTPKDVIIGTFIGRLLELKVSKLDIAVPEEISIELGISINNLKNQPTFKVKSYDLDPDTGEYAIKGMDYSYKFDVPFELEIPNVITNLELAQLICNYLGIEIENIDFANAGFQMTAKKVDNKFICRDIIAMIAADMGGIAFINSNNKLEFKKITAKNIIIENIFNTEIKNEKIGPINSVVLAREPQQDYINLKDDVSINLYGKTEVKITNNWLVDDNREGAIQAIYDNLYGIEFYCAMIESYQGFEVDPFDLVTISGRQILINNINIKYPMLLDGKIGIEQLSKLEIQQNIAKGVEKRVINAELKVDKITGQITSIVSEQTSQGSRVSSIQQDIDDVSINLQKAGGLNLIPNSSLRLGLDKNVMTNGIVTVEQYKEIIDNTISNSAIKINTGSVKFDTIKIKENENHTFSCIIYKKELANVIVTITSSKTEVYNITCEPEKFIEFEFPINSSIGQVDIKIECDNNFALFSDCMLNKGAKLSYQTYAGELISVNSVMSTDGWELTNSNSKSKLILNSEQTVIVNSETDEEIVDFNGYDTKLTKATIKDSFCIGKLRFTNVENSRVIVTFDKQ